MVEVRPEGQRSASPSRYQRNACRARIRLSDRKTERVVGRKNFVLTGYWDSSAALAPDDSPLLLRDAGTRDVYALDWEEP